MRPATPYRLLAASLAALCTLPAVARDGPATGGPATVEARLQARDTRHEVDDDGDFRVTCCWRDEGRTQQVFVGGDTQRAGELRIREVFAPMARVGADGLDAAGLETTMDFAAGIADNKEIELTQGKDEFQ